MMTASWMTALSETMASLDARMRQIEVRQAIMMRDIRELRKTKSGGDWKAGLKSLQESWLVRLACLFALLAFNFKMEDVLKIVFGQN